MLCADNKIFSPKQLKNQLVMKRLSALEKDISCISSLQRYEKYFSPATEHLF